MWTSITSGKRNITVDLPLVANFVSGWYKPGRDSASKILDDIRRKDNWKLGTDITVFQNQVPNSKGRAVIHSEELPPESQANYRPSHRPITARVTDQLPPARRGPRSGQPGSPAITPDLAD